MIKTPTKGRRFEYYQFQMKEEINMQPYAEMSSEELLALRKQLAVRYRDFQGYGKA